MLAQLGVPRPHVAREFQLRNLVANQESAIVIALVALVVIIGISSRAFYQSVTCSMSCLATLTSPSPPSA